jgi:hypothetical protein
LTAVRFASVHGDAAVWVPQAAERLLELIEATIEALEKLRPGRHPRLARLDALIDASLRRFDRLANRG